MPGRFDEQGGDEDIIPGDDETKVEQLDIFPEEDDIEDFDEDEDEHAFDLDNLDEYEASLGAEDEEDDFDDVEEDDFIDDSDEDFEDDDSNLIWMMTMTTSSEMMTNKF